MDTSSIIKLSTKEGDVVQVTKQAAVLSNLLRGAIQDFPGEITVPITEIDNHTTEKVLEYLNHYNGALPPEIEKPLKSENMKENTDEYSAGFIDGLSLPELEAVTLAANFLEIQPLLDLCCSKYVALVRDKSEEDLMKTFGIDVPFTLEEKLKIKEENPWLDEGMESNAPAK